MLIAYHTTEHRAQRLEFATFATGFQQWFGDGFYFWQDEEFALEWGRLKCRARSNEDNLFEIYVAGLALDFTEEDVLDTVFNQVHYEFLVNTIEKFAEAFRINTQRKPSLIEFNAFIAGKQIWRGIRAIRFQDLPSNNAYDYLKVRNFFYKKRIQIAIFDPEIILTFALLKTKTCE